MRREDREIVERTEIEALLAKGQVCRLAINNPSKAPYIVPLNYGFHWAERLELFFHCALTGHKLDLIQGDNRVGFEIDCPGSLVTGERACQWSMNYESIIGSGLIELLVEPQEKKAALDHLMRNMGHIGQALYSETVLARTLALSLVVEEFRAKRKG